MFGVALLEHESEDFFESEDDPDESVESDDSLLDFVLLPQLSLLLESVLELSLDELPQPSPEELP